MVVVCLYVCMYVCDAILIIHVTLLRYSHYKLELQVSVTARLVLIFMSRLLNRPTVVTATDEQGNY